MSDLLETQELELLEKPSVQKQEKVIHDYSKEKFPADEFMEMMPVLYKQYKIALENDRNSEERAFVWGELNPGLSQKGMFENAMKYLIEAEYLQKKVANGEKLSPLKESDLRGLNIKLIKQFGPENTQSYDVINQMRATVQIAYGRKDNFTNNTLLALLRNSRFEK
ncbi:hypothetical protein A2V49_04605 [candidate division WWE3 bacterium RBG_19FT_COMBO_34_6]|uniref:Uncharacterized protein n=1 Tax=candidate division WWE3 bacterium RBG_19FT_COMBO_34_6 TaxID=1802612 RepID=A0A1F4UMS1_UNCKA|nr:MAG: hypothetical protein A2V49_04605 [candidate division WWE3 bacterium RBG_19FT_COMBO_34_6]